MKPLKDRVLALPIKKENKSSSGLIIPGQQKTLTAKIIEIGLEVKHVKVDDTIMYEQDNGIPFNYKGETHLFLSEEFQVVAIL